MHTSAHTSASVPRFAQQIVMLFIQANAGLLMAASMRENGRLARDMDRACAYMPAGTNTKDDGRQMHIMARDCVSMHLETPIQVMIRQCGCH